MCKHVRVPTAKVALMVATTDERMIVEAVRLVASLASKARSLILLSTHRRNNALRKCS